MGSNSKSRVVLQFNEMDFRHRRALDILRQRPRSMSELVVNAMSLSRREKHDETLHYMNACLSDLRVVNPTLRTFSAAEARIAQSSIRFNNLSAAELGYPENVRLLISSEGTTLAIQACDKDDPCAVPFYVRKNRRGSEGAEKVDNRK